METTPAIRVAARYKKKKLVPKANGKGKTVVYEYSEQQVARRNSEKASRLEKLKGKMDGLRKQVKSDLKSDDPNTALTALAVALIDHTYERVGNSESAKGNTTDSGEKHFGVTTWKRNHISFGKGGATVSYVGKSGVKQKKKITDKAIVTALKNAYEGCEDDDIFCHGAGRVDATKVNSYLKKFGITAKDLRGFHANDQMRDALKAARKGKLPEDKKERAAQLKKEWKEALEATADAVGHEASTLASQYLTPGLEDEFLKNGEVMTRMKASSLVERFLGEW